MSAFNPGSFGWGGLYLPVGYTFVLTEKDSIILLCVSCFVEQELTVLKIRERLIVMHLQYSWKPGRKKQIGPEGRSRTWLIPSHLRG